MMSDRLSGRARRTACVALVLAASFALSGRTAAGNEDASPSIGQRVRRALEASLERRCLTPAIDGIFDEAVRSGAFRAALGYSFTLSDGRAGGRDVELTVVDAGGRTHTVVLALERIAGRAPGGRGGPFVFYLPPETDAESSRVLLGVAQALAERVPETALTPCRSREEAFGSRADALLRALLAVVVVVVALAFGFRTLGRRAAV